MSELIVGNDDCRAYIVAGILTQSSPLMEEWQTFAAHLGTPPPTLILIKRKLNAELTTYPDAFCELLDEWRARVSKRATLAQLIQILKTMSHLEAADSLQNHFH